MRPIRPTIPHPDRKGTPGNPNEPVQQELNSTQARKGKGDKGKGKGKGDHGKGKGDKGKGKGKTSSGPPKGGCFICHGPHWMSECPHNPLKKGQQGRDGGEHGRVLTEMNLCTLQGFTEVTNGVKSGKASGTGQEDAVEVRNRFEALTEEDQEQIPVEVKEQEGDRCQKKAGDVVRRWSRNASRKRCESTMPKEAAHDDLVCVECQPELNHGATLCSRPCSGHGGGLCPGYSHAPEASAPEDLTGTATGPVGESACIGLFQKCTKTVSMVAMKRLRSGRR